MTTASSLGSLPARRVTCRPPWTARRQALCDDHPVAARHRPLQVHDDAGRAASLSRRAGRVPVQVPQPERRARAAHRRRSKRASATLCALRFRGASSTTCAAGASSRATSSTCSACSISTSASSGSAASRAADDIDITIKGPWLHTILFEVPVLAIVSEIYYRNTVAAPDLRRRAPPPGGQDRADQRASPTPSSASPTTARGGASRACWQDEVVQTLQDRHRPEVRRHEQRQARARART